MSALPPTLFPPLTVPPPSPLSLLLLLLLLLSFMKSESVLVDPAVPAECPFTRSFFFPMMKTAWSHNDPPSVTSPAPLSPVIGLKEDECGAVEVGRSEGEGTMMKVDFSLAVNRRDGGVMVWTACLTATTTPKSNKGSSTSCIRNRVISNIVLIGAAERETTKTLPAVRAVPGTMGETLLTIPPHTLQIPLDKLRILSFTDKCPSKSPSDMLKLDIVVPLSLTRTFCSPAS